MGLDLFGKPDVRAIGFGDDQKAAGVFVYAMDDTGTQNAVDPGKRIAAAV